MLEKIGKLIPAISLLLIAILSLFNIGYFWRFGVHYLGVIDLSNLIYSFGLALVVITLLAYFVPAIVHHLFKGLSSPEAAVRVFRLNVILLSLAGFLGWFALFNPGNLFRGHAAEDGLMLISLCLGILALSSRAWIGFKHLGREQPAEISFIVVLAMGAALQAGLFTADFEASSPDTYNIVTKQQTIENARIIRASSNGFVLFVDDKAMFVPQSEIIIVKSNRSPSERY